MIYKVTHTTVVEMVAEYLVESDDEFFTEDEAIDSVIDFQDNKNLDNGVVVTGVQFHHNCHSEDFDVDEVEK